MAKITMCDRCGKKIDTHDVSDNSKDAKAIFQDGLKYCDVDFCIDCSKLLMRIIDDFWKGDTE